MEENDHQHDACNQHGNPAKQRTDGIDGSLRLCGQFSIEAGSAEHTGHQQVSTGLGQLAGQIVAGGNQAVDTAAVLPLHQISDVIAVGIEADESQCHGEGHGDAVCIDGTCGVGVQHEPDFAHHVQSSGEDHGLTAAQLSVDALSRIDYKVTDLGLKYDDVAG